MAWTMGLAALLLASLACVAMEPALSNLISSTPTAQTSQYWSAVDISKPTQTPMPPTPTPAVEEAATEAPTADAVQEATTEESPMITMVIVDDASQSSNAEQAPAASEPDGKYVLVSISEQHLYAYENGQLVFSFVASTGMGNSTRVGSFRVLDKIPSAYGANWNIWMPNWLGIYWSGTLENGIHALPILPGGARLWAGFLGTPISYGCVVLGVDEAMQLYDWADVGTPVEIRW